MKAAINGVLNLSILDGWFDEAYETSGGWAIGEREPYCDDQDALARQRHLLPARKRDRADVLRAPRTDSARVDAPREAIADAHQPGLRLPPHGARVHDGALRAGAPRPPAHAPSAISDEPRESRCGIRASAKSGTACASSMPDRVPAAASSAASRCPVRAAIDLAGLTPADVRVEVVIGRVDSNGHLEDTEVMVLPPDRAAGSGRRVRQGYSARSGPAGWAMRCASAPITLTIR